MRKSIKIIICIMLTFIITGCGSSYTCTKKYDENVKYKLKVTYDIDKEKKVISSLAVFSFKNNDDANDFCKLEETFIEASKVNCTNKTVRINNYHEMVNNTKIIKSDEFIKLLNKDGLKCR